MPPNYCALLGAKEDAEYWITRAFDLGPKEVKLKALDEADLQSMSL